ncbi:MAG: spiro-SPASM protein [Treponema sp.]|nr:spiro-SPASM protein [Treponema sp.]
MKNIVILYAPSESTYAFEPVFDGKSAFDRTVQWALSLPDVQKVLVFAENKNVHMCSNALVHNTDVAVVTKESWNVLSLLQEFHAACVSYKADTIVFAWADCPFLQRQLTIELLDTHVSYVAEYSFADGYPYGFAPEILSGDTADLLTKIPVEGIRAFDSAPVLRDSIQSVLKVDINSFEVETVIAKTDWRMYRFSFDCGDKAGLLSCKALYKACGEITDVEKASLVASQSVDIVQTVPGFYNVQISGTYTPETGKPIYCPYPDTNVADMPLNQFTALMQEISELSQHAVVDISAWGEPLLHPHFLECVKAVFAHPGLSLVIETDGFGVTEELAKAVADIVTKAGPRFPNPKGYPAIAWLVSLDAVSPKTYGSMRQITEDNKAVALFNTAHAAVDILERYFPKLVYPQMVRTSKNEEELETFYRYWSKSDSPSAGVVVIQKYDWFCGLLPNDKPADVSPVQRNPCWHIRRDMTILSDGSVPLCREYIRESIIGTVGTDSLQTIWEKTQATVKQHIKKDYTEKCSVCDEYYTFNF